MNDTKKITKKPWSAMKAFCMGFFVFSIPLYFFWLKHHLSGLLLSPIVGAELTYAGVTLIMRKKFYTESDITWRRTFKFNLVMLALIMLNLKKNWDDPVMGGITVEWALIFLVIHFIVGEKLWKKNKPSSSDKP